MQSKDPPPPINVTGAALLFYSSRVTICIVHSCIRAMSIGVLDRNFFAISEIFMLNCTQVSTSLSFPRSC